MFIFVCKILLFSLIFCTSSYCASVNDKTDLKAFAKISQWSPSAFEAAILAEDPTDGAEYLKNAPFKSANTLPAVQALQNPILAFRAWKESRKGGVASAEELANAKATGAAELLEKSGLSAAVFTPSPLSAGGGNNSVGASTSQGSPMTVDNLANTLRATVQAREDAAAKEAEDAKRIAQEAQRQAEDDKRKAEADAANAKAIAAAGGGGYTNIEVQKLHADISGDEKVKFHLLEFDDNKLTVKFSGLVLGKEIPAKNYIFDDPNQYQSFKIFMNVIKATRSNNLAAAGDAFMDLCNESFSITGVVPQALLTEIDEMRKSLELQSQFLKANNDKAKAQLPFLGGLNISHQSLEEFSEVRKRSTEQLMNNLKAFEQSDLTKTCQRFKLFCKRIALAAEYSVVPNFTKEEVENILVELGLLISGESLPKPYNQLLEILNVIEKNYQKDASNSKKQSAQAATEREQFIKDFLHKLSSIAKDNKYVIAYKNFLKSPQEQQKYNSELDQLLKYQEELEENRKRLSSSLQDSAALRRLSDEDKKNLQDELENKKNALSILKYNVDQKKLNTIRLAAVTSVNSEMQSLYSKLTSLSLAQNDLSNLLIYLKKIGDNILSIIVDDGFNNPDIRTLDDKPLTLARKNENPVDIEEIRQAYSIIFSFCGSIITKMLDSDHRYRFVDCIESQLTDFMMERFYSKKIATNLLIQRLSVPYVATISDNAASATILKIIESSQNLAPFSLEQLKGQLGIEASDRDVMKNKMMFDMLEKLSGKPVEEPIHVKKYAIIASRASQFYDASKSLLTYRLQSNDLAKANDLWDFISDFVEFTDGNLDLARLANVANYSLKLASENSNLNLLLKSLRMISKQYGIARKKVIDDLRNFSVADDNLFDVVGLNLDAAEQVTVRRFSAALKGSYNMAKKFLGDASVQVPMQISVGVEGLDFNTFLAAKNFHAELCHQLKALQWFKVAIVNESSIQSTFDILRNHGFSCSELEKLISANKKVANSAENFLNVVNDFFENYKKLLDESKKVKKGSATFDVAKILINEANVQ